MEQEEKCVDQTHSGIKPEKQNDICNLKLEMVFCYQNCSYLLRENFLKFEAEGREFAKVRTIFCNRLLFNLFLEVSHNKLEQT